MSKPLPIIGVLALAAVLLTARALILKPAPAAASIETISPLQLHLRMNMHGLPEQEAPLP